MSLQGSAPMKRSLTGWSDWTYCVQNEMSEVDLQGKRAACDEGLPIYLAPHEGRSPERDSKAETSQVGTPMSYVDLAHAAFCCGPGPGLGVHVPPHPHIGQPFPVTRPPELGLWGCQRLEGRDGTNSPPHCQVHVMAEGLTQLSQMPSCIPEAPAALCVVTTRTPLSSLELLDNISWLELPRARPCSLMQS